MELKWQAIVTFNPSPLIVSKYNWVISLNNCSLFCFHLSGQNLCFKSWHYFYIDHVTTLLELITCNMSTCSRSYWSVSSYVHYSQFEFHKMKITLYKFCASDKLSQILQQERLYLEIWKAVINKFAETLGVKCPKKPSRNRNTFKIKS